MQAYRDAAKRKCKNMHTRPQVRACRSILNCCHKNMLLDIWFYDCTGYTAPVQKAESRRPVVLLRPAFPNPHVHTKSFSRSFTSLGISIGALLRVTPCSPTPPAISSLSFLCSRLPLWCTLQSLSSRSVVSCGVRGSVARFVRPLVPGWASEGMPVACKASRMPDACYARVP